MYPRLKINLGKLKHNAVKLSSLCENFGISFAAVTKVFCAEPVICRALVDSGITILADSRLDNLKKISDINTEKWLIRPPMISEVEDLVRYSDVSLNSERETILAINDAGARQNKIHKIILMADLGDIREGFINYDELFCVASEITGLPNVELYGIGTNLKCFSFIEPDGEKMEKLLELARTIENKNGVKLEMISAGNSSTLDLMLRGGIPHGINNLRLGESLLFGKERGRYSYIDGMYNDAFILEAEIVEIKEKPSIPFGEVGVNSYGEKPTFTDRGMRRKAICALGKQDFDPEISECVDRDIILLGSSSDHLMLDVTDSKNEYKLGDTVSLKLGYFSLLRAFTSPYVDKVYID